MSIESWIQILHQAWDIIPATPVQLFLVHIQRSQGKVDCIMNWRFSATWLFLAFIKEFLDAFIAEPNLSGGKFLSKGCLEVAVGWKPINYEELLVFFG